jgi:inhibitor of cysteine peptidase
VPERTLTEADKGTYFRVHLNDVILVRLPENPTTGYQWAVAEINEEILELEDSDFVLFADAGIGGGGERRLRFKAKSTGTSHVELKMKREWEADVPPIERYDFTIRVE